MNALPVARLNDWLNPFSQEGVRDDARGQTPDDDGHGPHAHGRGPDAASISGDADPASRLSKAQESFLQLRLDAALSRLSVMATLIEAERLHARQAQAALALAERALHRHRETIVARDQQQQAATSEIERLKQGLHEIMLDKARQDRQIAALTAALSGKAAEIERLTDAGAGVEAELRASRTRQNLASDALQRQCLRLEDALQSERRDKMLLQRALDLARANRRALQDQMLHDQMQQRSGAQPHRLERAPGGSAGSSTADVPASACLPLAVASPVPAFLPVPAFSPAVLPPLSHPLEQGAPLGPPCPALTEQTHAACH